LKNDTSSTEAQAQRLEDVYEQLAALVGQPDVMRRLRTPTGEHEWSAMQILGHMIEMIPYWLANCRVLIAATEAPPQFGRSLDSPERLEGPERGATGTPEQIMRQLRDEVYAAMRVIRGMSSVERHKKGVHLSRGEMTVADIIEIFIVSHAEGHLAQVRATIGT
jgi:hypothetical protein